MIRLLNLSLLLLFVAGSRAEIPSLFNVQGRLLVDSVLVDGPAEFKFALVNADASEVYWRSFVDTDSDGQPDQAIALTLSRGLYSVALGDTNLPNMAALPSDVFTNSALFLRVWINHGTNGFQALVPDQRITPAGYAMISATVSDGAITLPKLAPGVLDAANLAGVLDSAQLPASVAYQPDLLTVSNAVAAEIASLTSVVQALSDQLAAITNQATLPLSGLTAVSAFNPDTNLSAHGFVPFMTVPAPGWVNGSSVDAPSARIGHSAIWTGNEMVVWGGTIGASSYSASGGIYDPSEDQWSSVSSISAPDARAGHSAIWTGSAMLVWGGFSSGGYFNSGARWQRTPQNWSALATPVGFEGRDGHVAVWAGARMLIWGGRNAGGLLDDGALYDPVLDQWTTLTLPNAPEARMGASVVWTGDRAIIWGGEGESGALNNGAQLVFDTNGDPISWAAMNIDNAPPARAKHTAIWTGERMVVWGGANGGTVLGDGGSYDPVNNVWSAIESVDAPTSRSDHSALWTGQEMLVFGGQNASSALATGGAYDPAANRWRALSTSGNPQPRSGAAAVWTGEELLVFGGSNQGSFVAALQRLNPQPAWHFYRKP